LKLVVDHRPGPEIADRYTIAAKRAFLHLGKLPELSSIAWLHLRISKILAAVITAKTDTVSDRSVLVVSIRPCHKLLFRCLVEQGDDIGKRNFFHPRAAGAYIIAEY